MRHSYTGTNFAIFPLVILCNDVSFTIHYIYLPSAAVTMWTRVLTGGRRQCWIQGKFFKWVNYWAFIRII